MAESAGLLEMQWWGVSARGSCRLVCSWGSFSPSIPGKLSTSVSLSAETGSPHRSPYSLVFTSQCRGRFPHRCWHWVCGPGWGDQLSAAPASHPPLPVSSKRCRVCSLLLRPGAGCKSKGWLNKHACLFCLSLQQPKIPSPWAQAGLVPVSPLKRFKV